jgi:transposase
LPTPYDSDPLRERLQKRGIELIAPYQENRQERRFEDGRKLRRYKRRGIVERTNSWLGQFRRLLVRHEHLLSTYRAFFYLACFSDYIETRFMKYALDTSLVIQTRMTG